jgi:uncharacterized protein YdgA (DUF945 family)
MRKAFFLVILLLLLSLGVWGASTYWFGTNTEEQYRAILQQASQFQHFKLLNEGYKRGFFTSSARTLIEFQPPSSVVGEVQPVQLTLVHDITHGPFPFWKWPGREWQFKPVMAIIETGIALSPETHDQLAGIYAQIPEIASTRDYTVIALDGSGEENLLIPAFQHTLGNEDKVAVDWKGLSLRVNFTADLKGYSGTLSVPGLEAVGKDLDVKIKELKCSFNSHEGLSGFSLGEGSFDLAHLEFVDRKETEPHSFLITGFSANSASKASGDNVNISVALRTDQVKLDEKRSGSGAFDMELRNLDAASLAKLEQIVGSHQTLPADQSSEALRMMMLARYMEILPGLLKKSPEIEIRRLELKTTDGDFTGKLKVAFDGSKPDATQNLLMLANAITAEVEFKVSEHLLRRAATVLLKDKMVEEWDEEEEETPSEDEISAAASAGIDEQLSALQAQGIIVREDGNYRASARYESGKLVLNGRALSLKDLMQQH